MGLDISCKLLKAKGDNSKRGVNGVGVVASPLIPVRYGVQRAFGPAERWPFNVAVQPHPVRQRFPDVLAGTSDRESGTATPGRGAHGLEYVSRLLPGDVAGRLRLRAFD